MRLGTKIYSDGTDVMQFSARQAPRTIGLAPAGGVDYASGIALPKQSPRTSGSDRIMLFGPGLCCCASRDVDQFPYCWPSFLPGWLQLGMCRQFPLWPAAAPRTAPALLACRVTACWSERFCLEPASYAVCLSGTPLAHPALP